MEFPNEKPTSSDEKNVEMPNKASSTKQAIQVSDEFQHELDRFRYKMNKHYHVKLPEKTEEHNNCRFFMLFI